MIHPTAIVNPEAKIHPSVEIGPFSIIDAGVQIGECCQIDAHVRITGEATLGSHNRIGYGSVIGGTPQDASFDTSIKSNVTLGDHNTIRENVTIHRSTSEGGQTRIGDHNFLMINAHLAHDVTMGNHNTLANNVMIAGHITIGDSVFLGGGAGFHQFVNIGSYCIIQGNSSITKDVPPYCMAHSQNHLTGLNNVGLKRNGFSTSERKEIKEIYNLFFRSEFGLTEAIQQAQQLELSAAGQRLLDAALHPSRKGLMT